MVKHFFANKEIRLLSIFSGFIILCLFIFLSLQKDHSRRDERNFHMPTAINFYEKPVEDVLKGEGYLTGTPPLPFIILKILTFGSYPNLFIYRLISLIFSLTSIILLINLLSKWISAAEAFFIGGLIFFQPYFLKSALTFYTAAHGVLFMVLFLHIYFKKEKNKFHSLILGLVSSAAILCHQAYLTLPFVYTIIVVYEFFKNREIKAKSVHLLFYLPHIIPLALFIIWGGITHDQPRNDIIAGSASFSDFIIKLIPFKNITAILTICGFYILPASVFLIKKIKWKYILLFLIISIFLALYNQPVFTKFPDFNKVTGIVHRIIFILSSYHPVLGEFLRIISITSFFVFISALIKGTNSFFSDFLILLIIALIGLFCFDFLLSERHLIPLVMVLYITLHRFKFKEIYYYSWFFMMMMIGCEYTIYWFNY